MGTSQSHCKPVQCWLSFNTSDDEDSSADDIPPTSSTMPPQNLLGFVQLTCYKPIYTTEEIPDRHLCIYKHPVPHSLCPYPCPYMDYTSTSYNKLDLSDISEFEDLMTTSSDEDIPGLDEIGY